MATFTAMASRALRLIGVLDPNDTADTVDITTCMEAANAMIAFWATRRVMIPSTTQTSFSIAESTASFSVGPGGYVDITLPARISQFILRDGSMDYVLEQQSLSDFNEWQTKSEENLPHAFAVRYGAPLSTVYLRSVPNKDYTGIFEYHAQITKITDASAEVVMPAAFEEVFVYSLAVRIAPEYQRSVSQEVAAIAIEGMRVLKTYNAPPVPLLKMPFTKTCHGKIYTSNGSLTFGSEPLTF